LFTIKPIGYVSNKRKLISDDNWGEVESKIVLADSFPKDALDGIEAFSHVEVIFYFHKVKDESIVTAARHPRNNIILPKIGIFSQRGKNRPNKLGVTIVKLLKREERTIIVSGLDSIDGTPVIDIKPVMTQFLPKSPITQPDWSNEIMKNYWE
jgi:tRNA-Thr(GGU) m(6)t(6)A37 methyltransferase TsaA